MFFVITRKKTLIIHQNPNSLTLKTLKDKIEQALGLPPNLQTLFLGSTPLMANHSLISKIGVKSFSLMILHCPRVRRLPTSTLKFTCTKPIGFGRFPICENLKYEACEIGVFASFEYDDEDKEADDIWEGVESRRRKDEDKPSNPTILEFMWLKKALYTLSEQEWNSILEIGDHGIAFDSKSMAENPFSQTPLMDLIGFGEDRRSLLSSKLDNASRSVLGLKGVNPQDFLRDMSTVDVNSSVQISDIKNPRFVLKSATKTNPQQPNIWIAAARLEEAMGVIRAVRKLIKEGCERCPMNEDVWLEACRLASPSEAKAVISRGVRAIPKSVKLWMQAAKLETDDANKSRVLRKGLQHIPDSVILRKAIVELSNGSLFCDFAKTDSNSDGLAPENKSETEKSVPGVKKDSENVVPSKAVVATSFVAEGSMMRELKQWGTICMEKEVQGRSNS